MVFIPIKKALNSWLKSRRFEKPLQERQVINITNQYFRERKNWPVNIVRASFFKQGRLIIKCRKPVISSELRLEETELKKYIQKRIPGMKIDKIFYRIE